MSDYGGDRSPYVSRDRTRPGYRSPYVIRDRARPGYQSHRPVRRKVGHVARVTVETGGTGQQNREEQEYENARKLERLRIREERLRIRARDERLGRPEVYYEPISRLQRRSSLPDRTGFTPGGRPSVPLTEPRVDDEIVEEVSIPIDDSYAEDVDFKFPKVDNRVLFSDDVAFLIPDSESNDSNEKPSKPKFTGEMNETIIAYSQWDGNTFERGELGAQIGTLPSGLDRSQKQPAPLMKWFHLHRPMMSFEEFMAASQSVLQLPEKEQRDVVKLLRDVQKKFEKQRHHGRELEADCVSDIFYNDATGSSQQTESVIFL